MFIWNIICSSLLLFHITHYCSIFLSKINNLFLLFSLSYAPFPKKHKKKKCEPTDLFTFKAPLINSPFQRCSLRFRHFNLFLFLLIFPQHSFPCFPTHNHTPESRVFTTSSSSFFLFLQFPQDLLHPPSLLRTRKTWAPLAD